MVFLRPCKATEASSLNGQISAGIRSSDMLLLWGGRCDDRLRMEPTATDSLEGLLDGEGGQF